MPSRQSRKKIPVEAHSESEEDVMEQSPHEQTAVDVLKTAQDLILASKRRREGKRRAIESDHEKRTKDVGARIGALFEKRKNRVAKSQKIQWERLDALNKRRSALEGLILASMKSIELHSANISNETCAMFGGRIEDIQEKSDSQAT